MSASKYDPLEFALTRLYDAERAEDTAPAPAPSPPAACTVPSVPRSAVIAGIGSDRSDASDASDRRDASDTRDARRVGRKAQLNLYVEARTAHQLREAVVSLGQRFSLGDLVTMLADRHLEALTDELAAGPVGEVRLRSGRKVRLDEPGVV